MKRVKNCIVLALLFVTCLFGCNDDLSSHLKPGYGRVAVTINGVSARTVFPTMAFEKYEYLFARVIDEQPEEPEAQEPVDGYFILKYGDWQATVNAYVTNEDTIPIITGTSDVFTVSDEAIAHIVIQLENAITGEGTFSYSITYPEGTQISVFTLENLLDNVVISISGSGETDEADETVFVLSGTKADVPAGYYSLNIELREIGEEDRTAGAREVVYIYDNLDSEYSIIFTLEDFSHIHEWEEWDPTTPATETENGVETRLCANDLSGTHTETRTLYATGTEGLAFELINNNAAYRVSNGMVTGGEVHIPAMRRLNANSPYLPVREIGSPAGPGSNGAFQNTVITSITIPASVTVIGSNAFSNCGNLTSIIVDGDNQDYASEDGILYNKVKTRLIAAPGAISDTISIPAGVTAIDSNAFSNCTGLTGITLPRTVTAIGSNAFSNCTGLTSIVIPPGVTSIGDSAFSSCTYLTSIVIPPGITSFGNSTFSNCSSLVSISIPEGVTSIGDSTFSNCSSLTSIGIPASVTSIGSGAFSSCSSLAGITVDAGNQNYASEDGILYNKAKTRLIIVPGKISGAITIPSGVTSIGNDAFNNCTGLTGITLPAGLTSIGENAFSNCTGLTGITLPASVTSIGDSAFSGCSRLTGITFPTSLTSIGNSAFYYCTGLTSITLSAGLTSIGDNAFSSCYNLIGVTLPAGLTSIGDSAFSSCSSLTSITLPASVTSIGDSAFSSCSRLASITLSAGLTSIGDNAFSNCDNLANIGIPASVTSIGDSAFFGCSNLSSIIVDGNNQSYTSEGGILYNKTRTQVIAVASAGISGNISIPSGITSIGQNAFINCTGLTGITIPLTVTSIGGSAFSGCRSLTSVNIPASVTYIGGSAFRSCTSLTGITIPSSVTSIEHETFYGCTSLTSITIPAGVTEIGGGAFSNCTSLTSITIPASVTYIGGSAFRSCTSLTGITIPSSVTSIEYETFYGCTSLTSVTIPAGVTEIGSQAFQNCTSLAGITIPAGVTEIGNDAFSGCTSLTGITVNAGNPYYASEGGIMYNKAKTALIIAPGGITGTVTIPSTVTSISYSAFWGCTGLTSITIPSTVTSIGSYAFSGWTNGQTINIMGHGSRDAADIAWGYSWRSDCYARIVYSGG